MRAAELVICSQFRLLSLRGRGARCLRTDVAFRFFSSDSKDVSVTDKQSDIKVASSVSRDSLRRLAELSRREWKLVGLSAATLGVTSSVTLILPFASGQVIDYTINSPDNALSPMVLAGGLFGLSAMAGAGVYLRSLWLARAGNRIVARLKQRLFASVLLQESAFLDEQTTGDLLSRLSADAQLVQSAVTHQAVAGLRGMVMTIGSASMLLYTSPTLAALSCCTLPPIFIITRSVSRKLQIQQEEVQKLQGKAVSFAEEALSSVNTVKQFVAEDYETTRYQNAVAEAHSKALETAHMQAQLEAGAHVAGNGAVLMCLGLWRLACFGWQHHCRRLDWIRHVLAANGRKLVKLDVIVRRYDASSGCFQPCFRYSRP